MKSIHPFTIFILSVITVLPVKAQQNLTAEIWFDQQVGLENTGLIRGHEYHFPFRGAQSHPFFFAEGASKGKVLYYNQWYADISLMYDLYSNEVILMHQTNDGATRLMCFDQSHLDSFSLFDHHFTKINGQFYDVIFKGKDWALVATRKKYTHVVAGRVEFENEINYFIHQPEGLTPFAGKKTLMSLCPQPRDLQVFIKQNKVKLGRKNEVDLVMICSFIDKSRQQIP